MRLSFLLLVGCAIFGVSLQEDLPSLEGARVYRLIADTKEKLTSILDYEGQPGYDILKLGHVFGDEIQILVTAEYVKVFETFLTEYKIDYLLVTENVQEAVEQEAERQKNVSISRVNGRISFSAYPRYDTIVEYLEEVTRTYSNIATLIQLGTSYENRPIYGLKLSTGGTGKPAVLVDGGIHAREWISPVTCVYLIDQLVAVASNSDLLESVDWYIFPVLNPDGYEFTFTHYRLWRKTRSVNVGSSCYGADPNRNFGHYWMLNGASDIPCSDVYAGTEAFSEPETKALRDFILANADTIKLYATVHSYGNYFLYPWGYTSELPEDEAELRALAEAADDALASVRGTRYTIGTSTNVLYAAAGGSDDWVKGVAGVQLSYTLELPGGGIFGFDLPASDINVVGQETFLAFRVFAEYTANKFGSS